jgi:hypothetical protein
MQRSAEAEVSVGMGGIDGQNLAIRSLSLLQPSSPIVGESPLKQITLRPTGRAHLLSTLFAVHLGILKLKMTLGGDVTTFGFVALRRPARAGGLPHPPSPGATTGACGSHSVVPRKGRAAEPGRVTVGQVLPLLAVPRSLVGGIAPTGKRQ